jgi:glycosyltransferase involved in cell wall biosynthesis
MPTEKLLEKLDFPLVEPSGDYYPVFRPQYEPALRNYKSMPPHQTPFLIGIVLPLCLEHRVLDALWAFESLNHVHLNYHTFIIGDGKDRETLLRYRDRWKLFSRVHFLGNQHGNRQIAHRLLPHFDVLLHLSSSTEYSGTILSAMSCGVPVVALETPESSEYISDGTTGILIPADGDFRFYRRTAVKKLLYLLENEELRRSMQIAAKERIEKKFNFETAVQRRIDVYRELGASLKVIHCQFFRKQ